MNSTTCTTSATTRSSSTSTSTKKRRRQDSNSLLVGSRKDNDDSNENVKDDNTKSLESMASYESTTANNNTNNNNNNSYYTYYHQNALQVDIDVLTKLLHRHSLSHNRTKYYQRMSMVLQLIRNGPKKTTITTKVTTTTTEFKQQKYSILSWFDTYQEIQKSIIEFENVRNKQQLELTKEKKRSKLLSKVFVSDDNHNNSIQDTQQNKVGKEQQERQLHLLQTRLLQFVRIIQVSVSECINRIEYATQSILVELVRGYFIPFHTIAIGCLGRIRTLLLSFSMYVINSISTNSNYNNINNDKFTIEQSSLVQILISTNDNNEEDSKFISQITQSIQMIQQYIDSVTTTTTNDASEQQENQKQNNNRWDPLGIEITRSDRTSITLQSLGLLNIHRKKKQKTTTTTTTTTTKIQNMNQKKSKVTVNVKQKSTLIVNNDDKTIHVDSNTNNDRNKEMEDNDNDDDHDEIVSMKSYRATTQNDMLFDDNDVKDDSDINSDYDDSPHRRHHQQVQVYHSDMSIVDENDDDDVGQSVAEMKQQQRLTTFLDDDDIEDQDENSNKNFGKYHELDRNAIILQSIQQQQRCQEEKEQKKARQKLKLKLKLKLKEQQKSINNSHFNSKKQKEEMLNNLVVETDGDDCDYHYNPLDNANTTTVNAINANFVKDENKNAKSSTTISINTAMITTTTLDNCKQKKSGISINDSTKNVMKKQKIKNKTKSKHGKNTNIFDDIFE